MPSTIDPEALVAVPAKVVEDGATPIKLFQPKNQITLAIAAVDPATTMALTNQIRAALITAGICK